MDVSGNSRCRTGSDPEGDRLANLPHRYSQFDMALAWEVKPAGGETLVEGIAKNLRFAFMEGIEIRISVVDAAGKTRGRGVCFIIPRQVKQGEAVPFTVKLPLLVEPGMLLKFSYTYDGSDGGDGGVAWMQSFEWAIPAI